ncbi:uncharacterized protein LOC128208412 [Mya arenaria]|uniref:uncharacterized protein LOC128208412 n=1 Tax=Mya arenaria TaxID=6604 RepID=UPI0022E30055|nr:uncharacterized protein LOC128208412 [Mya arenaria]
MFDGDDQEDPVSREHMFDVLSWLPECQRLSGKVGIEMRLQHLSPVVMVNCCNCQGQQNCINTAVEIDGLNEEFGRDVQVQKTAKGDKGNSNISDTDIYEKKGKRLNAGGPSLRKRKFVDYSATMINDRTKVMQQSAKRALVLVEPSPADTMKDSFDLVPIEEHTVFDDNNNNKCSDSKSENIKVENHNSSSCLNNEANPYYMQTIDSRVTGSIVGMKELKSLFAAVDAYFQCEPATGPRILRIRKSKCCKTVAAVRKKETKFVDGQQSLMKNNKIEVAMKKKFTKVDNAIEKAKKYFVENFAELGAIPRFGKELQNVRKN